MMLNLEDLPPSIRRQMVSPKESLLLVSRRDAKRKFPPSGFTYGGGGTKKCVGYMLRRPPNV